MAFLDAWVVDKTMFDYVSQGGCACCGITHTMLNLEKFQQCSDWGQLPRTFFPDDSHLDTDDQDRELFSPWPTFIHDDVQTQRCIIRASLKPQLATYKLFLDEHGAAFAAWFKVLSDTTKHRLFQLADNDVLHYLASHGDIHGPYGIVLGAVTDQIKNFHQTGYQDGRSTAELAFERSLVFEKGAFTVKLDFVHDADRFLACVAELAGPRLFPTAPITDDNQAENAHSAAVDRVVQSFRSDRRLVRLVLLRTFADGCIRKFKLEALSSNQTTAGDDATSHSKVK
ncbi:Aste57867_10376 [Aphanomyces stellatus]|uniref:Aste57867_10376 protein n=1 Tax=Aphanomyces stellatus TaxID=120398 RepID=A0A485KQ98_9STRA|nr:hypothetical protein As57867_010336 [Aphanomyces stellatus]VFT87250.1 Aste57867_10376 [Aphanomyces stellatus]